jgi:hypothetical protein
MSKSFKGYFAFGLYIAVLLALCLFRVRPSGWWLCTGLIAAVLLGLWVMIPFSEA